MNSQLSSCIIPASVFICARDTFSETILTHTLNMSLYTLCTQVPNLPLPILLFALSSDLSYARECSGISWTTYEDCTWVYDGVALDTVLMVVHLDR